MKPIDVGLTPELPYFRITTARRTPAITYLHLFECDKFSVRFFVHCYAICKFSQPLLMF